MLISECTSQNKARLNQTFIFNQMFIKCAQIFHQVICTLTHNSAKYKHPGPRGYPDILLQFCSYVLEKEQYPVIFTNMLKRYLGHLGLDIYNRSPNMKIPVQAVLQIYSSRVCFYINCLDCKRGMTQPFIYLFIQ